MHNRKIMATVAIAIITILNTALVVSMFRNSYDIFNDQPIVTADFTFHHHYSALGAQSIRKSFATWGYDPTFMAGSLFTPIFDPSNYLMELLAAALPFLSVALVIKLLFVLSIGGIPLLIFQSAINMGLGKSISVIAGLFTAAYLWFGLPVDILRYGMFLFIIGAAWGVFVLGWWMGFAEKAERKAGAGADFIRRIEHSHPSCDIVRSGDSRSLVIRDEFAANGSPSLDMDNCRHDYNSGLLSSVARPIYQFPITSDFVCGSFAKHSFFRGVGSCV